MTENSGSAPQNQQVTAKEDLRKFRVKLSAADEEKFKELYKKGLEKRAKAKEHAAPPVFPTDELKKLSVDLDTIIQSVASGSIQETPYVIRAVGGAGAQVLIVNPLTQRETQVGSIKGAVGPKVVDGKSVLTGEVDEINVQAGYQGRGLGYVLGIAFLARSEQGGATYMQLGTEDTSEGFWTSLNVAQNRLIKIAIVKDKVKGFSVKWHAKDTEHVKDTEEVNDPTSSV